MATTFPSYMGPSNIASSQFQYGMIYNDLNISDPAVRMDMLSKYGKENYAIILELLGRSVVYGKVENKQFFHWEDRPKHSSVAISAQVVGGAAGASITCQVAVADHYQSGAKSAVRVGEVGILATSGIQAQVTAINTSTPNAHTFTIKPLNTADALTSAGNANVLAGELFLFRGAVNIGEGSDKISGLGPLFDKISNTTTEHRDDFNISDVADSEKMIVRIEGSNYYRVKAVDNMNVRFMNNQFFKLMEGVTVNNIAGTYGTVGLIPRVAANGTNVQYTAGNLTLSDLQTLTRGLNFFGAPGEYHALTDIYSKQAITNLLFTTFKGTFNAVSYESVGGGKEAAVAYGFDTYRQDNITLHLFNNPMFNTEAIYKRTPTLSADYYRNYTLLIPQRTNMDSVTGMQHPSLEIVYQAATPGTNDKIKTWETGANSPNQTSTKLERNISMVSYPGARVFGANQFGSLKGI